MFFINLLLFLLFSANSFSALFGEDKENLGSVLSRLKNSPIPTALTPSKTFSDATIRLSTPLRPLQYIDKESPSFKSSPSTVDILQKERDALYAFTDYLHTHIPTVAHPKAHLTPLNASTVRAAALKKILIGPSSCFKSHVAFSPDAEDSEKTQIVVQQKIDIDKKDDKGRSNLERMQQGRAPLGPQDKLFVLHHLNQEDGLLVELSRRMHTKYYGTLHYRIAHHSSHINREKFKEFRTKYWKYRASDFLKQDEPSLRIREKN